MTTQENIPLASEESKFGKIRSILWPIHSYELKKLLPLIVLFFAICSNYNCVRLLKDALAVGSAEGAKVVASFKFYGVLPAALLIFAIYSKLTDKLTQKQIFYIMISGFIGFFLFFAFLIFPYQEALHPTTRVDSFLAGDFYKNLQTGIATPIIGTLLYPVTKILSSIIGGLALVVKHWTSALFFIMAELWGSVALSLLFWGFANRICKVSESKRFYALVGVAGNLAAIPLDWLLNHLSEKAESLLSIKYGNTLPNLEDQLKALKKSGAPTVWLSKIIDTFAMENFAYLLKRCIALVALNGLLILITYWWLNKYGLDAQDQAKLLTGDKKTPKKKMSMGESFQHILQSPYLLSICALVFAYGSSIQLIEVIWKDQVKLACGSKSEYMLYMSRVNKWNGALTAFLGLFVGPSLVKYCGWTATAMATPVILGTTGALFFFGAYFPGLFENVAKAAGLSPYAPFTAFLGSIQSVCSKAVKYSMFDPTKEMTYIPLDPEEKSKGKAAIDVLGARLGKTSSAAVNTLLNPPGHSTIDSIPYVVGLFAAITGIWVLSVCSLGKQFAKLTRLKQA